MRERNSQTRKCFSAGWSPRRMPHTPTLFSQMVKQNPILWSQVHVHVNGVGDILYALACDHLDMFRMPKPSIHLLPWWQNSRKQASLEDDPERRSLKGSRKLENSYSLARMYVKHNRSTGRVEVIYNFTHTNHSLGLEECEYLPLPLSVQTDIQEKFAQGVTLHC